MFVCLCCRDEFGEEQKRDWQQLQAYVSQLYHLMEEEKGRLQPHPHTGGQSSTSDSRLKVSSSSGNKLFFHCVQQFTLCFCNTTLRAIFFCNGCKHLHAWRLCSVWMNDNDGGCLSDRWVTVVFGHCVSSVNLIIHYIIVSVGVLCFRGRWTRLGRRPPTSPSSKQCSTGWGRCSWSRRNTEVVFIS